MGRLDSIKLGTPGAEVKAEGGSSCIFDVEMPFDEVKNLEWENAPARKLMHLGFKNEAVYSNGIVVEREEIRVGRIRSRPKLDERTTDALFTGAEHRIEAPLHDPRAEPLGLAYLRTHQLRAGGMDDLPPAHREIWHTGDTLIEKAMRSLGLLGFERKDLIWVLEQRYGRSLLPRDDKS